MPNASPQVITWRLVGRAPTVGHHFEWGDDRAKAWAASSGSRKIYLPLKGDYAEVKVYDRYSVAPGEALQAPLILEERESTIVVAVVADVVIRPDLTVSVMIKSSIEMKSNLAELPRTMDGTTVSQRSIRSSWKSSGSA